MNKEQSLLIADWWEKLQPLVRKFTRETHLAGLDQDDIRQECFLQLQKALENFKQEMGVSFAYYYKVVLCGWRANENRKNRGREVAYDEEQFFFQEDERVDIENDIERTMLIEQIKRETARLSEADRWIIVAYYFENKRLSDIALELGISYKTVEYRKKGAIHRLRRIFQQGI